MLFCSQCNLTFTTKKGLKMHFNTKKHMNSNKENKYKCRCGKSYSHRQGLHTHKKNCNYHTPTENSSSITADEQTQEQPNQLSLSHQLDHQQTEIETLKHQIKDLQSPQINILQLRTKISPKIRIQIREKQNNACGICKKDISQVFQLDHSIAIQFGGTNHEDNLMALCCECHAKKTKYEMNYRTEIKAAIFGILQKYMPSLQPAQDPDLAAQTPESGFSDDS